MTPLGWRRSATDSLSMILIAPTGMAITPITTSMGAIYGALAGKSSEHTDRAMSTLEAAIRTVNVHQRLRDLLVARISREYSVVPMNDTATADGEFGTVVEAAIHFVYLEGDGKGFNPKLALSVLGDMRIHRKGRVVDVRRITSSGSAERRTLEDWAAEDARAFREEIVRELEGVAEDVVSKLFVPPVRNQRWPGMSSPREPVACPGTTFWERLHADRVCPPAVTAPNSNPLKQ